MSPSVIWRGYVCQWVGHTYIGYRKRIAGSPFEFTFVLGHCQLAGRCVWSNCLTHLLRHLHARTHTHTRTHAQPHTHKTVVSPSAWCFGRASRYGSLWYQSESESESESGEWSTARGPLRQLGLRVPCALKWNDFEFPIIKTTKLLVETRSCTWARRI